MISVHPLLHRFHNDSLSVDKERLSLQEKKQEFSLSEKLQTIVHDRLNENNTVSFQTPSEKALLDEAYDRGLLPSRKKTYEFSEQKELMNLMQDLEKTLFSKRSETESSQQILSEKKQELIQFYERILSIIHQLSEIASRINR